MTIPVPSAGRLTRWRYKHAAIPDFMLSITIRGTGAVLALGLNVLFARILGVAEYGRYMTWLSMALVMAGVAVRGADQVLTRELAGDPDRTRHGHEALSRWAVGRVARSAGLLGLIYFAWIAATRFRTSGTEATWFAAPAGMVIVGFFAFCSVEAGAINGFSASLRSQALIQIVRNGSALVLLGVLYWALVGPYGAARALWLQAGSYAIASFVGVYWWRRLDRRASKVNPAESTELADSAARVREWTWSARHFFLITVAAVLVTRLDIVLVSALSGVVVAGLYAAGARLAQVALMVALAVNVVLSPRIAGAYKRGDELAIRSLLRAGLIFTVSFAVAEILVSVSLASQIVKIFGASYAHAAAPFAWVAVGYALWAVAAPVYAFLAMTGMEKVVAALSWLVLITNVGAMVALVPYYGAAGGGAAMAAGYALALLGLSFVLTVRWRRRISRCSGSE